ncbi:uncharacterized protein B0H18DRAFT_1126898 [Fomitopsis serialis]|uniref:uncharacterized protein n=1 Tax=Fomitopsis serialis TaxID=139415 RepID=UPI0020087C6A|nr:uncharacterized protein B0H18DRAFT_1126898 [Neoantrodia serialis]KAH9912662.1 hypothetical protein B0H18DRAFT_1126898 [Neoantrodia serialis]
MSGRGSRKPSTRGRAPSTRPLRRATPGSRVASGDPVNVPEDTSDVQAERNLPSRERPQLATSAGELAGRKPQPVPRRRFAIPMEDEESEVEATPKDHPVRRFNIPMEEETPSAFRETSGTTKGKTVARAIPDLGSEAHHHFRFKIPMGDEDETHPAEEDSTSRAAGNAVQVKKKSVRAESMPAPSNSSTVAAQPPRQARIKVRGRFAIPMDDTEENDPDVHREMSIIHPADTSGMAGNEPESGLRIGAIPMETDEADDSTTSATPGQSEPTRDSGVLHDGRKPAAAIMHIRRESEVEVQATISNAPGSPPGWRALPAPTPLVPRHSRRQFVEPPPPQASTGAEGWTTAGASRPPHASSHISRTYTGGQAASANEVPGLGERTGQSSSSAMPDGLGDPFQGHDVNPSGQPANITYALQQNIDNGAALTAATATRVLELTAERGIILARLEALGALQNANINNMEAVGWIRGWYRLRSHTERVEE